MRTKREWHAVLSIGLAALGVLLLLTQLGAQQTNAQEVSNPWPLTSDGRSRFASWSPDGRTVLVNRWGMVVGDGAAHQILSELWAVDLRVSWPVITQPWLVKRLFFSRENSVSAVACGVVE